MLVTCLYCKHEFHGKFYRDELGKYSTCKKCGKDFYVTQQELEFTIINSEGIEIKKMYDMVEDFKKEMKSDNVDIPMLDDPVIKITLWGVQLLGEWDISMLLNYLNC